ncbi:hypothetical protein H2204_001176 [Knufia peltigerae]|uniref:Very-long-chain 3-oxoacyl-CoA synthase n=1 Tax=Knufia peltigerae TaxID=1002370 RepID=A0AA38YE96_9EURO|nr:hypothetical protein H2204_001176 [Knufia peltigerae]
MDKGDRPLTSLQSVILTSGPFIFFWSTLRAYVERNGAFPWTRTVIHLNSQAYSLFSLVLAYLILNDAFHFQEISGIKSSDLAYVYHLSKFYEYIDVFNLVANGQSIGPHMAFHHITTPFLTYFRVLNASEWQLFAFLNCFHHFWMYAYFGGMSAFRPVLPITGWLQLAGGIALDVRYLILNSQKAPESANRAIAVLLLTRYAMLFHEELKGGSQQKSNKVGKKE